MKNRKTLLAVLALVVLFVLLSYISPLTASDDKDLRGYAWSSNIGWVNVKGVSLDGHNYGVLWNDNDTLTGYAWANPRDAIAGTNNIGWLNFAPIDASSAPESPKEPVKVEGNKLTGWARFCSAYEKNPDGSTKCSGSLNAEGWDGWVKMSGLTSGNQSYGVTVDTQNEGLVGYAWGGDVVGWLRFGVASDGECNPFQEVCYGDGNGQLYANLLFDDCIELVSGQAVADWTVLVDGGTSPYTYTWSGVGTGIPSTPIGPTPSKTQLTTVTYDNSNVGLNDIAVYIADSGVGAAKRDRTVTGSLTVASPGGCAEVPTTEGEGGNLVVQPGSEKVYIRYQASGQFADSVVNASASQLGAKIKNKGGSTVSGVTFEIKSGNDDILGGTTGPLAVVGVTCSFVAEGQPDSFAECMPGGWSLAPGETKLLRIRIQEPLKVISDNNPYTVTAKGEAREDTDGDGDLDTTYPSDDLTFDYLVSTFTPQ